MDYNKKNIPSENADTSNEKETSVIMVLIIFGNRSIVSTSYYMASRLKLMVFVKTASKLNLKDKMMRMYMQHKIDAFFIANVIHKRYMKILYFMCKFKICGREST